MGIQNRTPTDLTLKQGRLQPSDVASVDQEIEIFSGSDWDGIERRKQGRMFGHVRKVLADPLHQVMVFVTTKKVAQDLHDQIVAEGFTSHVLHARTAVNERTLVLEQFQRKLLRLLVMTNVDVSPTGKIHINLRASHILLYDYWDPQNYIEHVARALQMDGRRGHALTFLEPDQKYGAEMCQKLVAVLAKAGQTVSHELQVKAEIAPKLAEPQQAAVTIAYPATSILQEWHARQGPQPQPAYYAEEWR